MKNLSLSFITVALMSSCVFAEAEQSNEWNTGLKAGTLGIGLDMSTSISDDFGLRFNVNGLSYSREEEIDDINYDGELDLMTAGVLVDYYPFDTSFRLSAGAYYNNNAFSGVAKPSGAVTIEINGVEYSDSDVGQLDAEVTFNKVSPYIGMGWGNNVTEKGWGFTFDLGVMYHGAPDADLDVTINNPMLEAQIRDDVEAEKESLLNDIEDFKFYPVIMLGANYRF